METSRREGTDFSDGRTLLDNVMKEIIAPNIGVSKKQTGVITLGQENILWEKWFWVKNHHKNFHFSYFMSKYDT